MNPVRFEDLHLWKMEMEHISRKGIKRHEYPDGLVARQFEGL